MFILAHKTSGKLNLSRRCGLSLVELLGCIAAVTVGLGLGAYYLGLDLHLAAYRALEDNHVIEQLPEGVQEAIPVPAGQEKLDLTAEEIEAQLRKELDSLRLEVARLARLENDSDELGSGHASELDTPEVTDRREKTVVYWSRLQNTTVEVNELLDSSQQLLTEQNVWQVLEVRRRAYRYGAAALAAIDSTGVDPQTIVFAQHLQEFYDRGGDLYQQAVELWEGQQLGNETTRADVILENGRKQQQNEAELLTEQSRRLCEVLARRYGVQFTGVNP